MGRKGGSYCSLHLARRNEHFSFKLASRFGRGDQPSFLPDLASATIMCVVADGFYRFLIAVGSKPVRKGNVANIIQKIDSIIGHLSWLNPSFQNHLDLSRNGGGWSGADLACFCLERRSSLRVRATSSSHF